ncbi:MAG: hypothetical protein NVSMB27_12370 [Ktedonobacteraceae bacterium]
MTMSDRIDSAKSLEREAAITVGGQSLEERRPRDLCTLRRIAAAISIVLGPLAVGIVRATVPAVNPQNGQAAIAAMVANPDMTRVELTAGVVASFFLPFAVVGLTRLVMRRAPVLAMLGGALALVGWAIVPALVTRDAMTYAMAYSGANPVQLSALWDQVNGNTAVSALLIAFIIGHELGTLLLGIGLARARVVPLWAAAAVVIAMLLHPVAVLGLGNRLLDILAFALLVIGCVAAARAVLITPNDAWDLPPLSVRGATRMEVSTRHG